MSLPDPTASSTTAVGSYEHAPASFLGEVASSSADPALAETTDPNSVETPAQPGISMQPVMPSPQPASLMPPGSASQGAGPDEPSSDPRSESISAHETLESTSPHSAELEQHPHAQPPGDAVDAMSASVATLKPATSPTPTTATEHLTVQTRPYVDPTPPTPFSSYPTSRSPSSHAKRTAHPARSTDPSPTRSDAAYDEKRYTSEDEQDNGSRSEIQSIMEQFSEEGGGPGAEEVMSPRLEIASPILGSPIKLPPRRPSLEIVSPSIAQHLHEGEDPGASTLPLPAPPPKEKMMDDEGPPVPPKDETIHPGRSQDAFHIAGPSDAPIPIHRPPPPEPEPEPALPFDFHRFLEQLRNRKADPVARYLKSFLSEFAKRQWMVHEQVKIIGDFLVFISNKMAQCDVWRDVSDAEFDNAREGMEKLVMNRLYTQTFSPAISPPQPIPGAKPRKKGGERPMGPGRRGQHQEDVERDEVLTQKIAIYGWVKEEHLDIPSVSESGKRFLKLAQQELLKIKSYRAPRDKIICVLNCCKVIFGLLKHSKSDSSADSFMPLLIYVVLHANPENLVSNVQYILRFRNQEKLGGEAGYYLSSLLGVIQFIENMDRTTLTITDEEFESNVEAAVSAIAEKHRAESPPPDERLGLLQPVVGSEGLVPSSSSAAPSRPSFEASLEPSNALRRSMSSGEGRQTKRSGEFAADRSGNTNNTNSHINNIHGSGSEELAAITGLLRTIQKPLSTIGRIFSEDASSSPPAARPHSPAHTPQPEPGGKGGAAAASKQQQQQQQEKEQEQEQLHRARQQYSAEELAARQASAEAAEAQRLSRAEHANVVETLAGMFPDLDRDIISDVVYQKEGRVGLAVDACLALSS